MNTPLKNRYDFVYLFDCTDGNPNGDPDAANAPRLDPQTMQGLVSDVALKRKIRNYVYLAQAKPDGNGNLVPADGYDLHVKHGTVLNENIRRACRETKVPVREDEKADKAKAKNRPQEEIGQAVPVKQIVSERQGHAVIPDEFPPDQECLGDAFRPGLFTIVNVHPKPAAVAEQLPKARQVLRGRNQAELTYPALDQRRERIIDHRFVVNRLKLLTGHECQRIQP